MLLILTLILVAVALCAVILYLPQAAGLTSVERSKHGAANKRAENTRRDSYTGYIPPDEELRRQEEAQKPGSLRDRVSVTKDDMPIRIRLSQDGALRKRGQRPVGDINPNNYDYDLDELIREETVGEAQRAQRQYYATQEIGGDTEAMV